MSIREMGSGSPSSGTGMDARYCSTSLSNSSTCSPQGRRTTQYGTMDCSQSTPHHQAPVTASLAPWGATFSSISISMVGHILSQTTLSTLAISIKLTACMPCKESVPVFG